MSSRTVLVGCLAAVAVTSAPLGQAARTASGASPTLRLPSAGNVTVARLVLKARTPAAASRSPRLAVADSSRLPNGSFVAATVARVGASTTFRATVAIVRPAVEHSPAAAPRFVTIRAPTSFSLAAPTRIAVDALYMNTTPAFSLTKGGSGSILAGEAPKLPVAQLVNDAQLLALDRSVPLADMGLLGLPFVAAEFSPTRTTTLPVTIGMSGLSQINAVELRFSSGVKVMKVSGPTGVDGLLLGSAAQVVASSGFFQEGLTYGFTLELSRAPRKGDFVTVRASTHYFESSLPFTERFALV